MSSDTSLIVLMHRGYSETPWIGHNLSIKGCSPARLRWTQKYCNRELTSLIKKKFSCSKLCHECSKWQCLQLRIWWAKTACLKQKNSLSVEEEWCPKLTLEMVVEADTKSLDPNLAETSGQQSSRTSWRSHHCKCLTSSQTQQATFSTGTKSSRTTQAFLLLLLTKTQSRSTSKVWKRSAISNAHLEIWRLRKL